jgi:hypothetical protein
MKRAEHERILRTIAEQHKKELADAKASYERHVAEMQTSIDRLSKALTTALNTR